MMDVTDAITILKKFRLSDIAELDNAIPMALAALEKQVPIRPHYIGNGFYRCPICDCTVIDDIYCDHCGQKLDWSEVKE